MCCSFWTTGGFSDLLAERLEGDSYSVPVIDLGVA